MNLREKFLVRPGRKVRLEKIDPGFTAGFDHDDASRRATDKCLSRLDELQYLLYAEGRRALLVVLQGIDTAGKDGTIRHVMGAFNPQSCRVASFKAPTAEELAHDFLWRIHKAVPRRGEVVIFNRSHYEDVLVVRVHGLAPKHVWSARYEQINAFEETLREAGVQVVKFFLYIDKDEQRKRLQQRLDDPSRHWKVSPQDFEERKLWGDYLAAYEDALSRCSTPRAPWYVIPSNHKWFRNLAVAKILVETMEELDMKMPEPSFDLSKIKLK
jgi:PPK2 family polyphosphate:nucleotide phosphotransferase